MSKIFKKSLSVILAVALCITAMAGCLTSLAATYTANQATYKVTVGSVDSAGKVTATVSVSSATSTANLGAVMLELTVPGVPITAISATSTFDLSTTPSISSGTITGAETLRILLLSKTTGTNYSSAAVNITFDTSAKSLVEAGIDPDSGATLEVAVWGAQAACYGSVNDSVEPENNIAVLVAEDATTNAVGKAAATFTIINTCSHSYTSAVTTEPTCTVLGVRTYTCSNCGRTYTEDVAMLDHSYDNGVVTEAPTCSDVGTKVYTCSVCGGTKSESLPATGEHTYPTVYEGNEDQWTLDAEADCTTIAYAHPNCLTCGTPNMDDSVAYEVGYGPHNWEVLEWTQEQTCTTDGIGVAYCWSCGEEDANYTVKATGHTPAGDVTTVEPSCGEDGSKSYLCGTCDKDVTETLPATGNHSYDDGVVTTEPSCTVAGVKTFTCGTCGDTYTKPVAATGSHSYDDGVVTTEPSCTVAGVKTFTCGVCGDTYTEPVAATGSHTKAAAVYENNATTGNYDAVVKCSVCGEDMTRLSTNIPNDTTVNTAITPSIGVLVSDSVGIRTMLTVAQLSSYSSYTVRYSRVATDASYNLVNDYSEDTEFIKFTNKKYYTVNSKIGLYQMALPVCISVCGYDANGNLVAVSTPYVTTIVDEMWTLYNAEGLSDARYTGYVDLINVGTDAQAYFAAQGNKITANNGVCGLSGVALPKDIYAFDQAYASKSIPTYDTDTLPDSTSPSTTVTVGGKSCVLSKSVNVSAGAPAISYKIRRAAATTNPSGWSMEISYTNSYGEQKKSVSGLVSETNVDGFTVASPFLYYNYSPTLYDSNKTVTANIYYEGTLVYTDVYSIDTNLAQTIPTLTDELSINIYSSLAKFGASCRTMLGLS